VACLLYERLWARADARRVTYALVGLCCVLWVAVAIAVRAGWADDVASTSLLLDRLLIVWPSLLLFPLTLLAFALAETVRGTLGRRLAILGDLSYAAYMLHFPLMLFLVDIALLLGGDQTSLERPWMLAGFVVLLGAVSLLSHRYFETPARQWLRRARRSRPTTTPGAGRPPGGSATGWHPRSPQSEPAVTPAAVRDRMR